MNYGVARNERSNENDEITAVILEACKEGKARDIVSIDTSKHSDMFSSIIICSGQSDRQVQGIANKILDSLGKINQEPMCVEGMEKSHWIVIDCFEVIVHVFYEPKRVVYDLEGMWLKSPRRVVE